MSLNNSSINIQCFHYRQPQPAPSLSCSSSSLRGPEESCPNSTLRSVSREDMGIFFLFQWGGQKRLHVWFIKVNRMTTRTSKSWKLDRAALWGPQRVAWAKTFVFLFSKFIKDFWFEGFYIMQLFRVQNSQEEDKRCEHVNTWTETVSNRRPWQKVQKVPVLHGQESVCPQQVEDFAAWNRLSLVKTETLSQTW